MPASLSRHANGFGHLNGSLRLKIASISDCIISSTPFMPVSDYGSSSSASVTVPSVGVSSSDVPSVGVPSSESPSTTVPSSELPSETVPSSSLPSVGVPSSEFPPVAVPSSELPSVAVPSSELPSVTAPSSEGSFSAFSGGVVYSGVQVGSIVMIPNYSIPSELSAPWIPTHFLVSLRSYRVTVI